MVSSRHAPQRLVSSKIDILVWAGLGTDVNASSRDRWRGRLNPPVTPSEVSVVHSASTCDDVIRAGLRDLLSALFCHSDKRTFLFKNTYFKYRYLWNWKDYKYEPTCIMQNETKSTWQLYLFLERRLNKDLKWQVRTSRFLLYFVLNFQKLCNKRFLDDIWYAQDVKHLSNNLHTKLHLDRCITMGATREIIDMNPTNCPCNNVRK